MVKGAEAPSPELGTSAPLTFPSASDRWFRACRDEYPMKKKSDDEEKLKQPR